MVYNMDYIVFFKKETSVANGAIQRGNVNTLFSIGSRIKSTTSVVVIDFLDVDDYENNCLVASVALEKEAIKSLMGNLKELLEAMGDEQ